MNNINIQNGASVTKESALAKLRSVDKPIAIWGCGLLGKHILELLLENGLAPDCFLDRQLKFQGSLKEDKYPILSPASLIEAKSHCIIVASLRYADEMTETLRSNNLQEHVDFYSYNDFFKQNEGYCPICERETIFIEYRTWLRDAYLCLNCGSVPRQRSWARTLSRFVPNWRELIVHESSPNDISINFLSKRCKQYTYSKLFPDVSLGSYHNGIRCENLESLTFQDSSLDVFITQDVMEHVMHPHIAFREIERTLKPGGYHVFTVPIYERNVKSIQKARMVAAGGKNIEYLDEPEYHGDSLVTYHHGLDIIEKIGLGMLTTIILEKDRHFGLDGEFMHVFACKKL